MELGGQNICPTTFAPHVWHLRGKLELNLPYLPHLPHHPNRVIPETAADAVGGHGGRKKKVTSTHATCLLSCRAAPPPVDLVKPDWDLGLT
jgi:hypothetical protein